MKDIKFASSEMIKDEKIFPGFSKWQIGYGAFIDEYKRLLKEFKIEFDEKYLL